MTIQPFNTAAAQDENDNALIEKRFQEMENFSEITAYAIRARRNYLPTVRDLFQAKNNTACADGQAYVYASFGVDVYNFLADFSRGRAQGHAYNDAVVHAINEMNFSQASGLLPDMDGALEPFVESQNDYIASCESTNAVANKRLCLQETKFAAVLLRAHLHYGQFLTPGFDMALEKIVDDMNEVFYDQRSPDTLDRNPRSSPEIGIVQGAMDWTLAQLAQAEILENSLLLAFQNEPENAAQNFELLDANLFYKTLCEMLHVSLAASLENGNYVMNFAKATDSNGNTNINQALYTYLTTLLEAHMIGFQSEDPAFSSNDAKPFTRASGLLMQEFAKMYPLGVRAVTSNIAMTAPQP